MATAHSTRYDVLDSWRGIAALFIVLYHFRIHSNITTWSLIEGSYLFVDFFFALSGFVIAANYRNRLNDTASIVKFVILRFGRLYPLHFFMLAAYVLVESIALIIPAAAELSTDGVFASERNSTAAIFTNLLLIHSLGVHESATWNLPSWTISVEFYTYILFATLIWLVRSRSVMMMVAIPVASIVLIASVSEKMDVSYDYGIFRCLAGFFAGCVYYEVFIRFRELINSRVGLIVATVAELVGILLIYVFIAFFAHSQWSIGAPPLFSTVVFVFAFEKGLVSELLKFRLFLLLGALSYSIYMTHQFVQARIFNLCDLLRTYSDSPIVQAINYRAGELLESERVHGDIAYVPMLLAVVALSYLTYRFVEMPFRSRFRRLGEIVEQGAFDRSERHSPGRVGLGATSRVGQARSSDGQLAGIASVEPITASFTTGREAVGSNAVEAVRARGSVSRASSTRRACVPRAIAASSCEAYWQEAFCDTLERLNPATPTGATAACPDLWRRRRRDGAKSKRMGERFNVLGVGISAISIADAVATIEAWIAARRPNYVCITGVHGVMESQSDPELRNIHNRAGMVTPDGMPLVWLARLAGLNRVERVYGPDLLLEVARLSPRKGYRHFFYGGQEGVAELLARRMQQQFPGLQVAGTYTPVFRPLTPAEDEEIVRHINASGADIVWIGLSTPKQERWMAQHIGRLNAPVLIGVGAAFDFHAGLKRQAPYWMQRSGLEWAFRLITEPRRLAWRYLKNNPRFVIWSAAQQFGLRRYHLTESG